MCWIPFGGIQEEIACLYGLNMVTEIDKNKELGLCRPVGSSCEGIILADLLAPSHAQQKPNLPKRKQILSGSFCSRNKGGGEVQRGWGYRPIPWAVLLQLALTLGMGTTAGLAACSVHSPCLPARQQGQKEQPPAPAGSRHSQNQAELFPSSSSGSCPLLKTRLFSSLVLVAGQHWATLMQLWHENHTWQFTSDQPNIKQGIFPVRFLKLSSCVYQIHAQFSSIHYLRNQERDDIIINYCYQ